MTARVTFFEPANQSALAVRKALISVSKNAIATRGGKTVVFEVRKDQRIYQLPITTGAENQDQVLVTEGLSGSETLVLNPSEKLKQGETVKIKR